MPLSPLFRLSFILILGTSSGQKPFGVTSWCHLTLGNLKSMSIHLETSPDLTMELLTTRHTVGVRALSVFTLTR